MPIQIGDAFVYHPGSDYTPHLYFVVAIYEEDYKQKYLMYNTTTKNTNKKKDFVLIPEENRTPPFIKRKCTICYKYPLNLTENQINRLIRQRYLVPNGRFCQEIIFNIHDNIINADISEEEQEIIQRSMIPERNNLFG